jgi:hypothetical protein
MSDLPIARPLPTNRLTQTQNKRMNIHAFEWVIIIIQAIISQYTEKNQQILSFAFMATEDDSIAFQLCFRICH